MFDLKKLNYIDPILLSCTDGVGTKLKLAIDHKNLNSLGFDLVAMCVNDLLANGGEPLFFLDYIASSKIKNNQFLQLITSINLACKEAGCSLVGGETAEMPGLYKKDEFDLAGFSVGVVERKNILKKENVTENSILIGLESSGFHSNGYSLIRKIIKEKKISLKTKTPYKSSKRNLGDDLIEPTKIYVKYVLPLIKKKKISAIAHITGGGIFENLERIVPKNFFAEINTEKFFIPEKFLWFKEVGKINSIEMLKTFNCGIGLILATNANESKKVIDFLKKKGIDAYIIGKISKKKKQQQSVFIKKFGQWDLI